MTSREKIYSMFYATLFLAVIAVCGAWYLGTKESDHTQTRISRQVKPKTPIKTKIKSNMYPAPHYQVSGDVYTKHVFKGISPDGLDNEPSSRYVNKAKQLVRKSAHSYISHTANRSDYHVYLAPLSVSKFDSYPPSYTTTSPHFYMQTDDVISTTVVFIKKGAHLKGGDLP